MELTLEQKKAIAIADAKRKAAARGGEAAPSDPEWERGMLAPVERNPETGELRWAMPQIMIDAIGGMMAPGKAARGEYGLEIDEATGRPTTFTGDTIKDTMALSGAVMSGGPEVARSALGAATGNALRPSARKLILRAASDDAIPLDQIPSRLDALGPDAVLADLGPNLQKQAQAIATMPGPGQKTVVDTLAARAAGRNSRIIDDVNETLGPAPIPSRVAAENLGNRKALVPEYAEAFRNSTAVDTVEIAQTLDSQIVNFRGDAQKALQKVRSMLDVHGEPDLLDPNPFTLFQVRNAIDGMLETEANSKVIAALTDTRRAIDAKLAESVPGIKKVDAKYEELARQGKALEKGQTLLDSGRTATRPAELIEEMVNGAQPKGVGVGPSAEPFRLTQGARAEIDRLIGTSVNDLNALKGALKGDGSWNRERLATLFGQEKADKLLAILDREVTYSRTEGDALGGSRTATLQAAQDEIRGTTKDAGVLENALNLKLGSSAARAGDKALGWIGKARRNATNAAVADALMARSGADILADVATYRPNALMAGTPQAGARALTTYPENRTPQVTRIEM